MSHRIVVARRRMGLPMNAIALDNVTLSYARHPAVHHLSGAFARGSLTAITGPNGAGKSTLLKGIAGLLSPDEGSVKIARHERLAFLPQSAEIERDFPLSVQELVSGGLWHRSGSLGEITLDMRHEVHSAMAQLGLEPLADCPLTHLSAGQFQRALFARLMLQDATLILLDEPFTAVDAHTADVLMGRILAWHREGRTVLCVLHDREQIAHYFPDCLLLARECIAWGKTPDVLHDHPLFAAFHEPWQMHTHNCERAS